MMFARDAGMRRLAAEILMTQAATTIAITALCALVWGRIAALSALAGGAIGLLANAAMMLIVLRTNAGATAAVGRLMSGQLVKVVITVGLLLVVVQSYQASWPALLGAYAATLFVYWLVPVLRHRTRRVKD